MARIPAGRPGNACRFSMIGIGSIAAALRGKAFNFQNEEELQEGVGEALESGGLTYQREAILSLRDRADFLVGDVVVEVKIKGSLAQLTRQVHRYSALPDVAGVVVVTSLMRLRNLPEQMNGTPVVVICVGAGL